MTSKTNNWSQIATSIVIALIMLWGFFSSVNSSSPHLFRTATVLFFIAAIVLIIAISFAEKLSYLGWVLVESTTLALWAAGLSWTCATQNFVNIPHMWSEYCWEVTLPALFVALGIAMGAYYWWKLK